MRKESKRPVNGGVQDFANLSSTAMPVIAVLALGGIGIYSNIGADTTELVRCIVTALGVCLFAGVAWLQISNLGRMMEAFQNNDSFRGWIGVFLIAFYGAIEASLSHLGIKAFATMIDVSMGPELLWTLSIIFSVSNLVQKYYWLGDTKSSAGTTPTKPTKKSKKQSALDHHVVASRAIPAPEPTKQSNVTALAEYKAEKRTRWTPERRAEMQKLINERWSREDLAQHFQTTINAIDSACTRYSIGIKYG